MRRCIDALSSGSGGDWEPSPSLPAFDWKLLQRHAPDAHWVCVEGARIYARCSLWWRRVPSLPGERLGVIGHYAAEDEAGSRSVLDQACRTLRSQGCTLAVGPMDGNTWRRYRLITKRGRMPSFFLEPDNPDEWPHYFRSAGFETLASYLSALNLRLDYQDARLAQAEARMSRRGVSIRSIDTSRFEGELKRVYAVCTASFRKNFLYADIDEFEFLEQYRPMKAVIRPGLSLMAMQGDLPAGFIFALPDMEGLKRREPAPLAIIKTVAILPGRDYAGLGALLIARASRAAHELGFSGMIHALMHEENSTTNSGAGHARAIRRYELFSRRLV